MARTPNYQFERAERERAKAKKLADKAAAKQAQRERERADQTPPAADDTGADEG